MRLVYQESMFYHRLIKFHQDKKTVRKTVILDKGYSNSYIATLALK